MPRLLEKAIIKTLVYADLFDYPLTKEEIWERLIKIQNPKLKCQIKFKIQNIKFTKRKEKYYYLVGREEIIQLRKDREHYCEEKIEIARRVTKLLKLIPSVKFIGLTGAVAVGNADEDDDIDLLIITSANLLWTTRFLVTLSVDLMRLRRRPGDKKVKNKICLNMFIDENHLAIGKDERDLFTAYEIVQMKPLFEKENTYLKFIQNNFWVKRFLPNAIEKNPCLAGRQANDKIPLRIIESLLKKLQLKYMQKRRTTEKIKTGVIRFHPRDIRKEIMKQFATRTNSPLDRKY
ncbi:hypothetical protein MUP32_06570 [Candidatus Microgenomates bacterium]|nr:hypothetical protein [Candidatus Microgenomates bacterium]